jgi:hypothetical protein
MSWLMVHDELLQPPRQLHQLLRIAPLLCC